MTRWLILFLFLVSLPQLRAEEPGFGDLGGPISGPVSEGRRLPFTYGLVLDMLEEDVEQAWASYRKIWERAYEMRREPNAELLKNIFQYKDAGLYEDSVREARVLQQKMKDITAILDRVLKSAMDPTGATGGGAAAWEDHARLVRVLTQYNTLIRWGTVRSLDYDIWLSWDERDAHVLDPKEFSPKDLPLPEFVPATRDVPSSAGPDLLLLGRARRYLQEAESEAAGITRLQRALTTGTNEQIKRRCSELAWAVTRLEATSNAMAVLGRSPGLDVRADRIRSAVARIRDRVRRTSAWAAKRRLKLHKSSWRVYPDPGFKGANPTFLD